MARPSRSTEQALQLSREVLGEAHPDTLAIFNNLAALHVNQGRSCHAAPPGACPAAQSRGFWRETSSRLFPGLANLASVYKHQGRLGEAEPLYEQALQLSREVLGEAHPQTLVNRSNLADLHEHQGRYSEAGDSDPGFPGRVECLVMIPPDFVSIVSGLGRPTGRDRGVRDG